MNGRRKKTLVMSLAVLIAAALLAAFVHRAGDMSKVADALRHAFVAHPVFLAGGIALFSVSLMCGLTRWFILLRTLGIPIRFTQALRLYATGHFFNVLGPGATGGDLVKAAWFAANCPGLRAETITSIAAERLIGFFAMFAFTAGISFFRTDFFTRTPALHAIAVALRIACLASIAVSVLIAIFGKRLARAVSADRSESPRRGKAREVLGRVIETMHTCFSHPFAASAAFALSLANHVTDTVCYLLLSRSIGMTLPFRDMVTVSPIANTIAAVPVTPGGTGLRETMLQTLLDAHDVARELSSALGLLMLGTIIFWAIVGGVIMLTGPRLAAIKAEKDANA